MRKTSANFNFRVFEQSAYNDTTAKTG